MTKMQMIEAQGELAVKKDRLAGLLRMEKNGFEDEFVKAGFDNDRRRAGDALCDAWDYAEKDELSSAAVELERCARIISGIAERLERARLMVLTLSEQAARIMEKERRLSKEEVEDEE